MSLRSLALAYLEKQKSPQDNKLSQRDIPSGVPAGQMILNNSKTDSYAVPAHVPRGTVMKSLKSYGTTVPVETVCDTETNGTFGTVGTSNWYALQAEADRHNLKAKRQPSTDRYCRCGRLAELAWPLEGRHEMWRCFRCLEPMGAA